ncbi:MAG: adenylate/guanylate cyclase domain-containing protein [Anaerolineales bacterium]|nr:adenylate/guanylate cyclase domain-containing protein [Anaerolineales bacterium]
MYNFFMSQTASPLWPIEARLRQLLPANLYALTWLDTSPTRLELVFNHLRTLQRILYDYSSRLIVERLATGKKDPKWQAGTLMFTDLAGFTKLMEANAALGQAGAAALLKVLNNYFARMIEIISASGGDLMEFTGDALFAFFPADDRHKDTIRAVKAGLRMQRAMTRFSEIETPQGKLNLGMRVGIHTGCFLAADVGTPRRMEHVLLGTAVQQAKLSESNGQRGRVCISVQAVQQIKDAFRFEEGQSGYQLVVDDLTDDQLEDYEIMPRRKLKSSVLFERSVASLMNEITGLLDSIEPLASYIPAPVLNLLVESANNRHIPPDFPEPTVMFVNFVGLPELVDRALPGEQKNVINTFSRAFSLFNAAVEARGGVLKKVTYHLFGSDIVIYFGVPSAHTNDCVRAVEAALEILKIVRELKPPTVTGVTPDIYCQIGISKGPCFAAEVGEPRGRREFNVLGDTVNTTARLMNRAERNQILTTGRVHQEITDHFECNSLGDVSLKGKSAPIPIIEVIGQKS